MSTEAQIISFTVHGRPATAGSKRAVPIKKDGQFVRTVLIDDSGAKGKIWRSAVQEAALSAFSGDLLRGPLSLWLYFFVPRTKDHFGAKGIVPSAPEYPTKRPDLLKWARAVEDALVGVVMVDDSQIVSEHLQKRYGEPARCEVRIELLEDRC